VLAKNKKESKNKKENQILSVSNLLGEREKRTQLPAHTHTHNGMLLPSLLDALRLLTTHPPTTTTIISSGGGMEKSKTQKNGIEDKLDWRFFGFTFFQTRNHTQWPPASQIKVCQQLETAHTHTRVFSSFLWGLLQALDDVIQ
jgi:hypothetical protein